MDNLYLIACIGKNKELGANNKLIFNFKEDMAFFKTKTTNHTVIMGRKTYESIGKILPNRENIIITRNKDFKVENAHIFHDNEEVITYINKHPEKTFYIIGGSSIYKYFLEYCKKLYLTEVNSTKQADSYFPEFNKDDYEKNIISTHQENNIDYQIVEYTKK